MNISVSDLNRIINDPEIVVKGLRKHSKASENYVDLKFILPDGSEWEGSIPYFYRRTGLFIEDPEDLAAYLKEIKPHFSQSNIEKFKAEEKQRWENEMAGKQTTKGFFDVLLDLEWKTVKYDLPQNPNWARRIQDIKEFGYTLATNTNLEIKGKSESGTQILLVPIPKGGVTGYEVMSPEFKAKAISELNSTNIYEISKANKHGLIPDHKFPEIRWDEETKSENPDHMSSEEIKQKFQLVDNQRNQQKREVCRKCFQTSKRGIIFGINYFYEGNEDWPSDVPKVGKQAEKGCVGCGWYDIEKWRSSLNESLEQKNN